jgi:hypothetical protein
MKRPPSRGAGRRGARRESVVPLCCLALACVTPSDATAGSGPSQPFLMPPQLPGWKTEPEEPDARLPHLSILRLRPDDGAVDVDVSAHVLALGRQGRDHVGAVAAAEWLPKEKRWRPVGSQEQHCFRQEALGTPDHPEYRFSGQARCRRANFVLIFNLFSRRDRQRSETIWEEEFSKIVIGTRTRTRCLGPEEMTFLADHEGPPFGTHAIDANTVIVAAQSMCGSGGCTCFRYEKRDGCFHLVLPQHHCDENDFND